jgi:hypothetical protein
MHGRDNTKGLIDLGLVKIESKRYENGTIAIVRLTAVGKLRYRWKIIIQPDAAMPTATL